MFDCFETYISAYGEFTKEELKYMRSLATVKKIRRRQLLLKEGEVCRHKIFVAKGMLRSYRLKDDGTEYILRFSPENTWIIVHDSYNNQIPSRYNIDALEDTDAILWSREAFEEMMTAIPLIRVFSDKVKDSSIDASVERIMMNISYTVEEMYENFITSFPEVFRRVPLHMVASYLGVSRETLTRVRQARLRQQKD
ncbi:Crp/Fnr family transcriptional regulator [Chitinophaga filiformis]|uniref:cAMP-binding domain of CRP or a regulatory subunit of cAMP-dependent protein kinases n=1 Tax=Chitinophaga filiformis TaxID=104663 RepID=A0A1G8C3H4_CHIFI|nr:Crp/Fnr family transcriptional regulator [Chitinophaga filiformis]SDH39972.1 cAMP-binding domain of CRP or a regulatory subunit of cAMP-dependent protein kinases [Chitinophaga filiformis]